MRRDTTYSELSEQPAFLKGGELRDYQLLGMMMSLCCPEQPVVGVSWLLKQWYQHKSPILADEMGLGKTIQSISFLGCLQFELKIPGPFLVVVPLSTMGAWLREFGKWCPEMNVISYSGSKTACKEIQEHEFYGNGKSNSLMFNAMVTTYEYAIRDASTLSKIKWAALLVDEVQIATPFRCHAHYMLLLRRIVSRTTNPSCFSRWTSFAPTTGSSSQAHRSRTLSVSCGACSSSWMARTLTTLRSLKKSFRALGPTILQKPSVLSGCCTPSSRITCSAE